MLLEQQFIPRSPSFARSLTVTLIDDHNTVRDTELTFHDLRGPLRYLCGSLESRPDQSIRSSRGNCEQSSEKSGRFEIEIALRRSIHDALILVHVRQTEHPVSTLGESNSLVWEENRGGWSRLYSGLQGDVHCEFGSHDVDPHQLGVRLARAGTRKIEGHRRGHDLIGSFLHEA